MSVSYKNIYGYSPEAEARFRRGCDQALMETLAMLDRPWTRRAGARARLDRWRPTLRRRLILEDPGVAARLVSHISANRELVIGRVFNRYQFYPGFADEAVPISRVLEALGVDATARLVAFDEPAFFARPLATVGLDASHPVWGSLSSDAPLSAALEWAARVPASLADAARGVRDAITYARNEARWWASVQATEACQAEGVEITDRHRYNLAREAIAGLLHPEISAQPLTVLRIKDGALSRLKRGIQVELAAEERRRASSESSSPTRLLGDTPGLDEGRDVRADTLAVLPRKAFHLGLLSSVGEVTQAAISRGLWELLRRRREEALGDDPSSLGAAVKVQVRESARAGLAELASLFDGG